MAKNIDYPRASFKRSLQLAKALEDIGGAAAVETVADKMNKKVSGSFNATVAAAIKFGLAKKEKGQLKTTPLLNDLLLAYSSEEEINLKKDAFLRPPLFRELFIRFKNRKLPTEVLAKILIREYDVPSNAAERIGGYFLDGAKTVGLLGPDMTLSDHNTSNQPNGDDEFENDEEGTDSETAERESVQQQKSTHRSFDSVAQINSKEFTVRISGPDMNSVLVIKDTDDLDIVEIILSKVRKKLESSAENEPPDA